MRRNLPAAVRSKTERVFFQLALTVLCLSLFHPPALADPQLGLLTTIQVPGKPLSSFDIGFVDSATGRYYLADRSNSGVDIIDTRSNTFIGRVGGFTGPAGAAPGPNGVVVVNNNELWAGDGDSTMKVIDLVSNKIVASISTGGMKRADEVANDPKDGILMAVNNADNPPFATLISTDPNNRHVLGTVHIPGATGGLEQPVWDGATGKFYLSVPQLNGIRGSGAVAQIDPITSAVTLFPLSGYTPAGLALGPNQNLLVGGGTSSSLIISALDGHVVANIPQVGGSDEVWYNPGDNRYYLGASGQPGGAVLGVIDAGTNTWIENIRTVSGAHSVAADSFNNEIFVPLPATSTFQGGIGVYAALPEPSSVSLFVVGMGLLTASVFTNRARRRRQGRSTPRGSD